MPGKAVFGYFARYTHGDEFVHSLTDFVGFFCLFGQKCFFLLDDGVGLRQIGFNVGISQEEGFELFMIDFINIRSRDPVLAGLTDENIGGVEELHFFATSTVQEAGEEMDRFGSGFPALYGLFF